LKQVEVIEAATNELHEMCIAASQRSQHQHIINTGATVRPNRSMIDLPANRGPSPCPPLNRNSREFRQH
jgi:hypothetical protein